MDLIVATRSPDKMHEIRRILADVPGLRVYDLDEAGVAYDPAEEELERHDTFEENARSKAEYFHRLTGRPTVADDSGLEVEALGGAPGVRSKRFAPEEVVAGRERDVANNLHLLALLADHPPEQRRARYVCVAVLAESAKAPVAFHGEARGWILEEHRGLGGFGYDPLFFDPELDRTFAEVDREVKNARSHRGMAFRSLADELRRRQ